MVRLLIALAVVGGISLVYLTYSSHQQMAVAKNLTDSVSRPLPEKITVTQLNDPYWNQLLANYEQFIQRGIDSQLAPGVAVVIVKDTSIIFLKGFGYRNSTTREPVDESTVFRLGSVSKCFASVLSGVLVQENILRWDDHVTNYLPGFALKSREHTENISLRHILSHTTGLPYHAFTNLIEMGSPLDTMVHHLRDLDLLGKPGQLYSYQNVAYSVIGQVIQSATGKTYEAMMREKVFAPLHMNHASLSYSAITKEKDKASPHRHGPQGWVPVSLSPNYYNVGPAGGINASISDMGLFLTSLTRHKRPLLDSATQSQIFHPFVKASAKNRYFYTWKRPAGAYYGLGWRIINFKDETICYHGGYVNGFRSEIAIHPKERIAICVLVNAAGPLADQSIPEFFKQYDQMRMIARSAALSPKPPAP